MDEEDYICNNLFRQIMTKKKEQSLSWEAFQSLGNPDNVEDETLSESKVEESNSAYASFVVRIVLKRMGGGKKASVIKGIDLDDDELKKLSKGIKSLCGVGGSAKNGEIIIQGDKRERIKDYLISKGFSNTKLSGG